MGSDFHSFVSYPSSSLSEETIMDIIASLMVLPNRMCIPLIDQVKVDQMRFPLPRVCEKFHSYSLLFSAKVPIPVGLDRVRTKNLYQRGVGVYQQGCLIAVLSAGCGEGPPVGGQRPGGQGHVHDGPGEGKVGSLRNNPSRQPSFQERDRQGELAPQVERGLRGRANNSSLL